MSHKSPKVFLTGSTGFIGKHLRRKLDEDGFETYAVVRSSNHVLSDRDYLCELSQTATLKMIFDEVRPDFVIALAGRSDPSRNLDHFDLHYRDNVLTHLNLAKSVPKTVKLTMFFGSCEEYGNGKAPFQEEQKLETFSPYGWSKISAYHATKFTCNERGVPYSWIRPFLVFGPGQDTRQLIPAVIRSCIANESLDLTPGEQTRDFIFVNDLVEMTVSILRNHSLAISQSINLGTGFPRTIKSVAESIQKIANSGSLKFGAIPYRTREAMSFYASMDKYKKLYGNIKYTDFEKALEATIAFQKAVKEGLIEARV